MSSCLGPRSWSATSACSVAVPRENYPAWPCLNSKAGFAAGPWIEVGEDPVQFDLLFGE